jgi:hypothetical protein
VAKDGTTGPEWAASAVGYLMKQWDRPDAEEHMWRERLVAAFRSETDVIALLHPDGFSVHIGTALQRFPKLREFIFLDDGEGALTEADVTMLLSHIRRMESLESITINTPYLNDASLASLARHPKLNTVKLGFGSLSPQFVNTLRTLPNLKELHILPTQSPPEWYRLNTEHRFRNALPGVTVSFDSSF